MKVTGRISSVLLLATMLYAPRMVAQAPADVSTISIDGSSTVFPVTEAISKYFERFHPDLAVDLHVSGTGGGLKRLIAGEIDIANASRKPKPAERVALSDAGIKVMEFPVAYDGISVTVHPSNAFARDMTLAELREIWRPGSTITKWSQVRNGWPDRAINLYGPGHSSGTFDYFTSAVNGRSGDAREDYFASEDDAELVEKIAGDPDALGFFGFAYYIKNTDRLHAVSIDFGRGPIKPSFHTINIGEYKDLSRSLYLYVNEASLQRKEVKEFLTFYMKMAYAYTKAIGYIPYPKDDYKARMRDVQNMSSL